MTIRFAREEDIPRIDQLLLQVCQVHHQGRPDLFRQGGRKYTDEELRVLLQDKNRPILVAVDEKGWVEGYAFCILEEHGGAMTDHRTLYLDDLCVDSTCRGRHVGSRLYRAALDLARELGCYNLTLNVWSCNPEAMAFYERMGLKPLKVGMEAVL